jgi:hypothetical protein
MSEYEAIFAGGSAEIYRLYEGLCPVGKETINPRRARNQNISGKDAKAAKNPIIVTEIKKVRSSETSNVEHRTSN